MDIILEDRCLAKCSNKFLLLKSQPCFALFGCFVKIELDSAKIQVWKTNSLKKCIYFFRKAQTYVKKSYSTLLNLGYSKPILSKYLERLDGKHAIK